MEEKRTQARRNKEKCSPQSHTGYPLDGSPVLRGASHTEYSLLCHLLALAITVLPSYTKVARPIKKKWMLHRMLMGIMKQRHPMKRSISQLYYSYRNYQCAVGNKLAHVGFFEFCWRWSLALAYMTFT